jgi:hypothetical protein
VLRLDQAGDRCGDGGLAGSGLADQPEHLASGDMQLHPVRSQGRPAAQPAGVADSQVPYHQCGIGRRGVLHRSFRGIHRHGPVILPAGRRVRRSPGRRGCGQDGVQELPGVTVAWPGEQVGRAGLFDHDAAVQHHDPVGQVGDDTHVMRDEQDADAEPGAQGTQQLQDLSLSRHVERARRFVGDQQRRLVGQCYGDPCALRLASGQLMRVSAEPVLRVRQAHQGEQADRPLPGRLPGHRPVHGDRFDELGTDGEHRVEPTGGLLEHQPDLAAPDGAQFLAAEAEQVAPPQERRAGHRGVAGQQAHQGQGQGRLARARFPDQREHFAGCHGQADVHHRRHRALAGLEGHRDRLDRQQHPWCHRMMPIFR